MGLQFQKDKNSSPSRQDNMAVNTGQDSQQEFTSQTSSWGKVSIFV